MAIDYARMQKSGPKLKAQSAYPRHTASGPTQAL